MKIKPGNPYPLGPTLTDSGVNFALYSENATGVDLCLFDHSGKETHRIPFKQRTAFVWHALVEGISPGQSYGYRVHGSWNPEKGFRFNPNVLLIDPYAKALSGIENHERGIYAYDQKSPQKDLEMNRSEVMGAPKSLVLDTTYDWEDDTPPRIPFHRSVIYEVHVKGISKLHPDVPENQRGTYSGLASDPIIRHLRELGITAVELLPVHQHIDDTFLLEKGLKNYWGYNTVSFFAPEVRYKSYREPGGEIREFKDMVKKLHRDGIEVILDVVYNHTAEGNHLGPTLSFKGIDNPTYYRLTPKNPRFYFDYTGTGNSINVCHPQTLQLIMDSLRYWIQEMHIDGFRFDLASTLAREMHAWNQLSSFFTIIHQDPVISQVKLIAEPWDVGEGGYQVGNFPVLWAEWNGKYRDSIRSFIKGDGGYAGEIGYRLSGSSDLYEDDGRRPYASINFITAHDGFTLNDLVSYNEKHNEANGEGNRDGHNDNRSWNCGAEGETKDLSIKKLRARQQRNFLATLLLSQGTPMLCGGDEFGRTQRGNNNAYCQDNEISWFKWNLSAEQKEILSFTRNMIRLRLSHPGLHRAKFFKGREIRGNEIRDIIWFRPDGHEMDDEDWNDHQTRGLGVLLSGTGIDDVDEEGEPLQDDNMLILFNASYKEVDFLIPFLGNAWELILDTDDPDCGEFSGLKKASKSSATVYAGQTTPLIPRSLKVYKSSGTIAFVPPRTHPHMVVCRGGYAPLIPAMIILPMLIAK